MTTEYIGSTIEKSDDKGKSFETNPYYGLMELTSSEILLKYTSGEYFPLTESERKIEDSKLDQHPKG